jgi:hypothetical protein
MLNASDSVSYEHVFVKICVIDLPELDSRYQITANSEDEVIVTKPLEIKPEFKCASTVHLRWLDRVGCYSIRVCPVKI